MKQILTAHSTSRADEIGIRTWKWDTQSLDLIGEYRTEQQPSWVSLLDSNELWIVSEQSSGLAIHLQKTSLQDKFHEEERLNQGQDPCHLLPLNQSDFFVCNYSSGDLSGRWRGVDFQIPLCGSGSDRDRQQSPHPHFSLRSPCEQYVLVADLGSDRIWVICLENEPKICSEFVLPPGTGPRHMVWNPSATMIYLTAELSNEIFVLSWSSKQLSLMQIWKNSFGSLRNYPSHPVFHRGRLWVAQRGGNTLSCYELDSKGLIQSSQEFSCEVDFPRHFAMDTQDNLVAIGGQRDGKLALGEINAQGQYESRGVYNTNHSILWVGFI